MNFSTKFHWQPNWKILLFAAVFLPLCIALGFWQLDRADQKRQILAAQEQQQARPSITNQNWTEDSANHLRRVELVMTLHTEKYLLLANRILDGQVGYEVIGLAQTFDLNEDRGLQFVNRGWVPASLNRDELPEISTPSGLQKVEGYFYCPEPNAMIQQSIEFDGSWPAIIFSLDAAVAEEVSKETGLKALPCEIRVDSVSSLAFRADWQIVNQPVAKHIGYAVQWFSMAFALIILALFSNSNLAKIFRSEKTISQSKTSGHTNHDK